MRNKANSSTANCRNGTGQLASAFGGVVGLRIVQNEPNSPALPGGTRPGGRGTRANVQNKPNFREAAGAGVGCTNKPNSCHCADPEVGVPGRGKPHPASGGSRAKQTQFFDFGLRIAEWMQKNCRGASQPSAGPVVQTNPIARSGAPRRCRPVGCTLGGARCAKRTQFPPLAEEVGLPTPNPFALAQGRLYEEPQGSRMQNKLNSAPGPIGRNKPNLPGAAGAVGCCTNKANLRRSNKKGKCFAGKDLW